MLPHMLMMLGFAASPVAAPTFQVSWALYVNAHYGMGA